MTNIITNTTGSKAVNIVTTATGTIIASYVQIYKGQEQVLESKDYATVKGAEKWAKKMLN